MTKMEYSYASITKSCTNYGNFFIEEGLRRAFEKKSIPEPSYVFDAFKEEGTTEVIKQINSFDKFIIPGCTTLTIRHYPTLEKIIPSITVPIVNTGATFWDKPEEEALPFIDKFTKPVGCRDPLAHEFLEKHNIASRFIGCPTLFLGDKNEFKGNENDTIIYFYSAKEIDAQQKLLNSLKNKYSIKIGIVTEEQKEFAKAVNIPIIDFDIPNLVTEISKSRLVISGRLHGSLPSLVQGTPVIFLSTFEDMRFSLLDYLGVPRIDINRPDLTNLVEENIKEFNLYSSEIYKKIDNLKSSFLDYLDLI